MPNSYVVVPFYTGCLSGTLDENKLTSALNEHAARGWRFVYAVHETRKVWLFIQRETHFLVFERAAADPTG